MAARQSARIRRRRHAEAADWLLRNREPGRTAEDVRRFEDWLNRDPENRTAYAAAERLMGEARTAILSDPDLKDLAIKSARGIAKPVIASICAVGLAGGVFLLLDGPMRLQADVISKTSEMPVIALSDGSTLQLNAHSAVAYEFTPTTRTVRLLRGEAFFQVARDAERPFVVEAGGGRTTALGTAFDVRLDGDTTDVTVTEHAVSVTSLDSGQWAVRVEEGQRAAYGPDGQVRDVSSADVSAALAWRRGLLVVDNATLAAVVTEIGRHFSGRIVIAGTSVAERRVSGTLAITDTDAALAFLEQTLGVTVTRIGPLIIIRG